jgi:hypothetical protein
MIRRAITASVLFACFWTGWTTPARGQELGKLISDGQSVSGHAHNGRNAGAVAAGVNVPMWPGFFFFNGVRYNFTMVGSDPTVVGAGTTNVPVVIIPLSFSYPNGTVVSPIAMACGDNTSVLTRIQGSPLFTTNVTWVEGNTVVGVTQFTDAFQRANFWAYVSTRSPNYHVLLNPVSTTPVIQVNVPVGKGQTNANNACPQQPLGTVDMTFLDNTLRGLITQLGIGPNTLPLFVAYDMVGLPSTGGFFFGYHTAVQVAPGVFQTYAFGSYTDNQFLGFNVADISILSHELGEWLDDPVSNPVPPWGHIGQVTGCQANLEVGDPLTGSNSTVFTPGFNYHVQDLAFFSWFARQVPSIGVNGWYSTLNAFASPPPVCF